MKPISYIRERQRERVALKKYQIAGWLRNASQSNQKPFIWHFVRLLAIYIVLVLDLVPTTYPLVHARNVRWASAISLSGFLCAT